MGDMMLPSARFTVATPLRPLVERAVAAPVVLGLVTSQRAMLDEAIWRVQALLQHHHPDLGYGKVGPNVLNLDNGTTIIGAGLEDAERTLRGTTLDHIHFVLSRVTHREQKYMRGLGPMLRP